MRPCLLLACFSTCVRAKSKCRLPNKLARATPERLLHQWQHQHLSDGGAAGVELALGMVTAPNRHGVRNVVRSTMLSGPHKRPWLAFRFVVGFVGCSLLPTGSSRTSCSSSTR